MLLLAPMGLAVAKASNTRDLEASPFYSTTIGVLLAVGLYGSVYQIGIGELRKDMPVILRVVTIGVALKALLVGSLLYAVTGETRFVVYGIAMAQIDPLSVASAMPATTMTVRAERILSAWAAFDDPVTTLLVVYAVAVIPLAQHAEHGLANAALSPDGYVGEWGVNAGFALVALIVWRLARDRRRAAVLCLLVLMGVAVSQFLMLGVALIGLFFRPGLGQVLPSVVRISLWVSVFMLGMLLLDGINPIGVLLGIAAFVAQVVVGWILTWGLEVRERVSLAFAQLNGITSIVLALLLEPIYPGTVSIVAPAVVSVNALYVVTNHFIVGKHESVASDQAVAARRASELGD